MSSIEELTAAVATAKAAYKANKGDKSLKQAHKDAKAALAAAVAAAEAKAAKKAAKKAKKSKKRALSESEASEAVQDAPKKVKVDVESLRAAAAAAKAAYKANKGDASLKAAHKAAKAALAAAEAAPAEAAAAEPEPEAKEEEPVDDMSFLKKNKKPAAAPATPRQNQNNNQENPPCPKVFIGNLPWSINDDMIREYFKEAGSIEDISWLSDRETGRFKGCGFLVFESTEAAQKACERNGQDCHGREVRINFAKDKNTRTPKKAGGKFANRELSEKPEGCIGVFVGNLSFDIDDPNMHEFAKEAGCGEIAKIRWLTDRESGDFKGCGFIDFYDTADVDLFVKKNGAELLGRNIRIDYATPRAPRD